MSKKKAGKSTRSVRPQGAPELGLLRMELTKLKERSLALANELNILRRFACEGVLATEILRLEKGDLPEQAEYEELRREALRNLVWKKDLAQRLGLSINQQKEYADKYALGANRPPCSDTTNICHAVCCRERFPLAAQDVVEGVVEYDLDSPYTIKMSPSGYCIHFDTDSMKCNIWEQRPARCRLYTCRWDRTVWKSYEELIPSDQVEKIAKGQGGGATDNQGASATVEGKPGITLDPSTFHVFEEDGDRLLYDVSMGRIMHVEPVAFDILSRNGSADYAASIHGEEVTEAALAEIERLKASGFFSPTYEPSADELTDVFESLYQHQSRSMFLYVSQACNMACKYCYAEANNSNALRQLMTLETAKRAVDHLVEVSGDRRTSLSITFFGGEPLLNWKVIKDTVAYCRSLEKPLGKRGKRFRFKLSTNGTLLSPDKIRYLADNQFAVLVSLDGPPEIHDRVRVMRDGSPSHHRILPKALALEKATVAKGYHTKARANLTRFSPSAAEISNYLEAQGFSYVGIATIGQSPEEKDDGVSLRADVELETRNTNTEAVEARFMKWVRGEEEAPAYNPILRTLQEIKHSKAVLGIRCGVARNTRAIDTKGDIYPCHRFVGMQPHVLGNIWEGGLSHDKVIAFYRKLVESKQNSCRICWARRFCRGGCPWEWARADGTIREADCPQTSEGGSLMEKLLHLHVRLKEEYPSFFTQYIEKHTEELSWSWLF